MIKERLSYEMYVSRQASKSKIDPTKIISVEVGMQCPHCSKILDPLSHEQSTTCSKCGLRMTLHGNYLDCELD